MLKCWSERASERPTFAELKSKFDNLLLQNNPYIQFSSYATTKNTTENPPGYDHLPPPPLPSSSDSANPSTANNGVVQNVVRAGKARLAVTRTLSAPMLDHADTDHSTSVHVGDGASHNVILLRSPYNSYVDTPTAMVNSRIRVSSAGNAAGRSGEGKKQDKGTLSNKDIHEKKRRSNTETQRMAHLNATRVGTMQPTTDTTVHAGYDCLDPIEERDCSVESSTEEYDRFPSMYI